MSDHISWDVAVNLGLILGPAKLLQDMSKEKEKHEMQDEKPVYEWVFFPARANWFVT